jgi:hypothetical protein
LCDNATTRYLRETFSAIPLRVPEARVKPLLVIARHGDKTDVRGELQYLFKGNQALDIQPREDTVASVSLEHTATVNLDLGLKILGGFLQGLKLPQAPVGGSFQNVSKISFSFTNVMRRWLDINHLGSVLMDKELNLDHPALVIFKGEDAADMLLISDAIVSKSFTINSEESSGGNLSAGIPAIQQYIADLDVKVKLSSATASAITFTGDEYLTFAFSCVRLDFDPETGKLSLLEAVNKAYKGEASGVAGHELLDDNAFRPGMLSWDEAPAAAPR